ncbi:MAG: hypothetical protein ACYTGG_05835 [Planctomycetota bacterium]|jgi:hypothetical protein
MPRNVAIRFRFARPAAALAIVLIATLAIGRPAPSARQEAPWMVRLEALSPDNPMAYFELAEEIADTTEDERELDLARHLFKLAGVLEPDRLGRSACLALADLEHIDHVRARYFVLASLLDNTAGLPAWTRPDAAETISRTVALGVSEALGHFRQGQGPKAISTLRDSEALEFLERQEHLLPYGMKRFLADCNIYRGGRRPTLARVDILRMLRAEHSLLAGEARGWTSDLLLKKARPLVEVDPDRLPAEFGLSTNRPLYRNGRWIGVDSARAPHGGG